MFLRNSVLMEKAGEGTGGGGDGTPAAFDKEAFKAELFGEFDRRFNGFTKALKADLAKFVPKPKEGEGDGTDPPPDPKAGQDGKQTSAELKLQRELEKLRKEVEEERRARTETEAKAKETSRKATISAALNGHQWANEKARLAAERLFDADVRYNEAGELVAGPDEQPVADYIKSALKDHEYLLAPKPTGGSGLGPGSGKAPGAKAFTLEDIKPGMSPEDLEAVRAHIAQQFSQS